MTRMWRSASSWATRRTERASRATDTTRTVTRTIAWWWTIPLACYPLDQRRRTRWTCDLTSGYSQTPLTAPCRTIFEYRRAYSTMLPLIYPTKTTSLFSISLYYLWISSSIAVLLCFCLSFWPSFPYSQQSQLFQCSGSLSLEDWGLTLPGYQNRKPSSAIKTSEIEMVKEIKECITWI